LQNRILSCQLWFRKLA